MTLDQLPRARRDVYTKITDYMTKNKGATIADAAKASGLSSLSQYYAAKKQLGITGAPAKAKILTAKKARAPYSSKKNKTVIAESVSAGRPMVALVGSSSDVIVALKGLL